MENNKYLLFSNFLFGFLFRFSQQITNVCYFGIFVQGFSLNKSGEEIVLLGNSLTNLQKDKFPVILFTSQPLLRFFPTKTVEGQLKQK